MTPAQKQTFLGKLVAVAKTQIGVTETSNNWSNIIKQYLAAVNIHDPASWCMAFAVWCVLRALAAQGLKLDSTTLVITGYCPTQVDHARSLGALISAADVATGKAKLLPGYLMVENIPAEKGYHHTGVVVETANDAGEFVTVEGNTNHTGASQGNAVLVQYRNLHDTASDGTAKYAFIATC